MVVISMLGRQSQEHYCKFESSWSYIVKPDSEKKERGGRGKAEGRREGKEGRKKGGKEREKERKRKRTGTSKRPIDEH